MNRYAPSSCCRGAYLWTSGAPARDGDVSALAQCSTSAASARRSNQARSRIAPASEVAGGGRTGRRTLQLCQELTARGALQACMSAGGARGDGWPPHHGDGMRMLCAPAAWRMAAPCAKGRRAGAVSQVPCTCARWSQQRHLCNKDDVHIGRRAHARRNRRSVWECLYDIAWTTPRTPACLYGECLVNTARERLWAHHGEHRAGAKSMGARPSGTSNKQSVSVNSAGAGGRRWRYE